MKRTKKDYLNLLKETVDFYTKDINRRAIDHLFVKGRCRYFDKETGNRCAVGRCMKKSKMSDKFEDKSIHGISTLFFSKSGSKGMDSIFKKKYQGFSLTFWWKLQRFHDSEAYWDYKGISDDGKDYVETIKGYIEREFSYESK